MTIVLKAMACAVEGLACHVGSAPSRRSLLSARALLVGASFTVTRELNATSGDTLAAPVFNISKIAVELGVAPTAMSRVSTSVESVTAEVTIVSNGRATSSAAQQVAHSQTAALAPTALAISLGLSPLVLSTVTITVGPPLPPPTAPPPSQPPSQPPPAQLTPRPTPAPPDWSASPMPSSPLSLSSSQPLPPTAAVPVNVSTEALREWHGQPHEGAFVWVALVSLCLGLMSCYLSRLACARFHRKARALVQVPESTSRRPEYDSTGPVSASSHASSACEEASVGLALEESEGKPSSTSSHEGGESQSHAKAVALRWLSDQALAIQRSEADHAISDEDETCPTPTRADSRHSLAPSPVKRERHEGSSTRRWTPTSTAAGRVALRAVAGTAIQRQPTPPAARLPTPAGRAALQRAAQRRKVTEISTLSDFEEHSDAERLSRSQTLLSPLAASE